MRVRVSIRVRVRVSIRVKVRVSIRVRMSKILITAHKCESENETEDVNHIQRKAA